MSVIPQKISPFTKRACLCCLAQARLAGKFEGEVRVGVACIKKARKPEMDSHYVTKPSRKTHTHYFLKMFVRLGV